MREVLATPNSLTKAQTFFFHFTCILSVASTELNNKVSQQLQQNCNAFPLKNKYIELGMRYAAASNTNEQQRIVR